MAENMEARNFDERLKTSLRKMVRSCDNYIKDAKNPEQLEENLKHMEETDENFHKYELVQILSDRLESKIGELIDRGVNDSFNSSKFDGDIDSQNRLAEKICNDIIKHKEFVEFKSSFQASTNKAADHLLKNFHANFVEMSLNSDEVVTLNEQNEIKSISFSNDFEFSSPDNSMNQNSFVFVTSEQFPVIAQNLDAKKPEQVRMRAMQQLLAIPASDPQAADHWIQIRRHLICALRDPCEAIANLCLKLHSRTLALSHHKVSVEIYINLVDYLTEYFRDRELDRRPAKTSVDFSTPENSFVLKIVRLMNDYAKDIPSKWTRYPDRDLSQNLSFIETLINETLKLLSLGGDSKSSSSLMTPLHFLSAIDIKATWFTKWMHGHDSRKILLHLIKNQEHLLQSAVASVLQYASSCSKKPLQDTTGARKKSLTSLSLTANNPKRMQFKKSELEYIHFVHSLNILRRILCFKNGRQLFPVKGTSRETTIKDLIKSVIQIIFDTANLKSSSDLSPSKCAYDLLQDLCVTEETCEACLCNEEVIEQLIKPIKSLMASSKKNQFVSSSGNFTINSPSAVTAAQQSNFEDSCLLLVANILSKLATTQHGYRQLVFNDSRKNFPLSANKNSAARTIASFVQSALKNQLNLPMFELAEYLYLIRLLYSKCQGTFLIGEYALHLSIAEAWINSDSKKPSATPSTPTPATRNHSSLSGPNTPRQQPNPSANQLTWPESLLDNLLSMASTPKGVFYLNETNLTSQAVNYLSGRYRNRTQVGKYEKFGYGFVISQLSNSPSGAFFLNECEFVQYLIDDIWTELEYGSDDFMSAFPRSFSVEPIDKEVYKPMICLMNICSSFASVYELLVNLTATPRSNYGVRDVPKGLVGLLDRVVFLDKKLKIASLCNYEQSHMFGLRLLGFLQSDLDILLLIESQYHSTRLLLALQNSNRSNSWTNRVNNEDEMPSLVISHEPEDETESCDVEDSADKSEIIVDLLSVERNIVLVSSNLIGGPSERLLPKRNLGDLKNFSYKYPLFDQLPVPSVYVKKVDYSKLKTSQNLRDALENFDLDKITKSPESQRDWSDDLRGLFLDALKSSNVSTSDMGKLVGQFAKIAARSNTSKSSGARSSRFKNAREQLGAKFESTKSSISLSSAQKLGVDKTIQYGIQIGALDKSSRDEHTIQLSELHKRIKFLLLKSSEAASGRDKTGGVSLTFCEEDSYPGYDWFAAVCFLLNRGQTEATLELLLDLIDSKAAAPVAELMWPAYHHASSPSSHCGMSALLPTTCHYVELVLKTEQPLVFSAFRMSGLAPSQICLHWIKQCFLNYLDWPAVAGFVATCFVLGLDYQTYFCVSLLKHLNTKQAIVQHHTNRDLPFFMRENQIDNFRIEEHIQDMTRMEARYRAFIQDDFRQCVI